MFELLVNTLYDIYSRFVSCFKNNNNLKITNIEYDTLPDYEPMNEMKNINKLKIQIPNYQFVFLEDD